MSKHRHQGISTAKILQARFGVVGLVPTDPVKYNVVHGPVYSPPKLQRIFSAAFTFPGQSKGNRLNGNYAFNTRGWEAAEGNAYNLATVRFPHRVYAGFKSPSQSPPI